MNFFLVLVYGISLSMDAFAVAICKGLALKRASWRDAITVGAYFGVFQGLMPLAGYFLANSFKDYIEKIDHWIAFGLLTYIGVKMVWESHYGKNDPVDEPSPLSFKKMLPLAVATSIDALAVGIAFFCDGMPIGGEGLKVGIFVSVCVIALTTFLISAFGVKLGRLVGDRFRSHAELVGGIVLILLGIKILVEHTTGISILGL